MILRTYAKKNLRIGLKEKRPNEWWMRCPYHGGGRENTGSMIVNADPRSKRFFTAHCFACKKHLKWPELAFKIGCDPIDVSTSNEDSSFYNDEAVQLFTDSDKKRLLGLGIEADLPIGFAWPENLYWRNIQGQVVHDAGGILYIDKQFQEERLFLPLIEDGELYGGVRANVTPKDGGNYFNTPGLQSTKHFLFYDLAERMLEEIKGTRILSISEGPRDALNTVQLGVPSLANLGSMNSWTPQKVDIVLRLDPDLIILGMDADETGRACAEAMINDLSDFFPIHDVIFPHTMEMRHGKQVMKKKFDTSDLNEKQFDRIIDEACKANGFPSPDMYDWTTYDTSEWEM